MHNWATEYGEQPYTAGQMNTVNNRTQLDNWMLSKTVHWTTEYSQQQNTSEQLNTFNNQTQLDNWTQLASSTKVLVLVLVHFQFLWKQNWLFQSFKSQEWPASIINTLSREKVRRINKMMNKGENASLDLLSSSHK